MEPIKEEPEDFGANTMMLSNIEQYPDTVGAGALVVRGVDDQSESDTMTLGETDNQFPTDDMYLDEMEDFSDAFRAGELIERDSDEQSEASTVVLVGFIEEENQFALTPEPCNTPGGSSSLHYTHPDSHDDQTSSLPPSGSETCMACQEGNGRHFFGYCGPCAFQEGRWRPCDVCQRSLPSVGWRGLCFDCVPMTDSEKGYIWPPGTVSIAETLGLPRLHTCLRCGNQKEFEKTCEVCWGRQPQEDNGPIVHQSNGTLDPD